MNEQPAPAEAPEVEATRVPATSAMTVSEGRALEAFGGAKQFQLARLTEQEFVTLLENMRLHNRRKKEVQRSLMVAGTHYGIPGKKPAEVAESIKADGMRVGLFKAGMELLLQLHRYVADVKQVTHYGDPNNVESPAIRVDSVCHVHADSLEGPIVAVGVGSANSWETKYRYRNAQRKCPACGQPFVILSKYPARGGPFKDLMPWWCNKKSGGCGAEFHPEDPQLVGQEIGRIANSEAYDLENTLVKMSAKRAKVDGTITATGSSDLFTQDLEDLSPEARARVAREVDAGAEAAVEAMYGGSGDPDSWRDAPASTATPAAQPQAAGTAPSSPAGPAEGNGAPKPASDRQKGALRALLGVKLGAQWEQAQAEALRERFGCAGFDSLSGPEASRIIGALNKMPDAPKAAAPAPTRAEAMTTAPAAAAPAAPAPERPVDEGPLADTAENRTWLANRVRHQAVAVEEAYPGRKVIALEDGVWFLIGGNELALMKLSRLQPLDYFDVAALQRLGAYLKAEYAKKAVPA